MDPGNVLKTLGYLVRDYSIFLRRAEVIEKHGEHSYNLRPRESPPRSRPPR